MNFESSNLNNNSTVSDGLQLNTPQNESSINNSLSENSTNRPFTLRESVDIAMKNFFSQLEEQQPVDLYNLVLAEVEAPLMESVMKFTRGNQTKASEVLGLNRGTLRKKLKAYGLN
ncbi:MAG: Fis family transcriptional regulator [Polaribacter sp.]|jgi:Fis family transcriptional regulator